MPTPPDRLDELEEAWTPERPTAQRTESIVRRGPPASYPPPSTATLVRSLRAWVKANAALLVVLGLPVGGQAVLPWRDWLDVPRRSETVAALQAEAKRNDDARKAQDATSARELKRARDAAGRAVQRVDDIESQLVAQKVLVESMKPRRR